MPTYLIKVVFHFGGPAKEGQEGEIPTVSSFKPSIGKARKDLGGGREKKDSICSLQKSSLVVVGGRGFSPGKRGKRGAVSLLELHLVGDLLILDGNAGSEEVARSSQRSTSFKGWRFRITPLGSPEGSK